MTYHKKHLNIDISSQYPYQMKLSKNAIQRFINLILSRRGKK